ncbi:ABC transporter ATP-binding protein [Microbacterium sp. 4R-513]|uniref:ABC transporter ATP-binding protein n=1 Tax=Microbacterium sp. 4R-513 TaxID=2567934 RepID=UPI0013E16B39|nr:ABC transporter ATP-binding protein [Microbacterium sp. 4R-513]QIG39244.1 ABC transporter ATP-binding protein [Microbacterium sp. 4R-513]
MPEGQVLEFSAVTKRFGAVTAVDGFTARVEPGRVTGFLGPNGAGKTTTLRILLGLVRATQGTATIGGVPYAKLKNPLQSVGAVLEASSFHPGRTAANHLKVYAQAAGLPSSRIEEALGLVGLGDVADRKVGGYSLGMRQRLGLAYALIGDPGVLVLDEPANGLDPEGIKWMRGLLRELARQGRTVLVSSHLLAEVQQTVDSLLIIAGGRLVFQGGLEELSDPAESATVVDSRDRAALSAALRGAHVDVEVLRSGLTVRGLDPAEVGQIAADAGIALTSLQRRGPALEEVFLDLVNGTRVHASAATTDAAPAAAATAAAVTAQGVAEVPAGDVVEEPPVEVPEAGAEGEAKAAEDSAVEPEADRVQEASRTETTGAEAAPAAFAVASTGVIDIITTENDSDAEPADGAPVAEATDETVEATEEPDEEAPEAPGDDAPEAPEEPAEAPGESAGDRGVTEEILTVHDQTGDVDVAGDEPRAEPATAAEEWASVDTAGVPTADGDADAGTPDVEDEEPDTEAEPEREDTASAEWDSVAPAHPADAPAEEPDDTTGDGAAADEEASAEPPADDSDRPWERYVKTDADVEADRFFAAFDDSVPEASEPEGGAPFVNELETPQAEDLGAPSADWHAQPEPLPAEEWHADEPSDEPSEEELTEELEEQQHEHTEGDETR